ncbi:Armadillo-like helical [Artemisia annua]|uniref:Armadillo-like helical n=1 Tax=Artemisia annua TaxID=35608 RepID=A0A2U1N492_ARTAN|nr:Armadillo-like helical [Artemisia annua]
MVAAVREVVAAMIGERVNGGGNKDVMIAGGFECDSALFTECDSVLSATVTRIEDELTTKKLVCLFSSANSGHAQASVCNIVATVHPEAAGALRQECMALVTRCTGLSDNKEKQVQVREVPQERREKPAKHATKDSGKSKRTSGKKSSDAKSSFYEDYIVSVGIAWQLKDLLTHSNTQKAVLGCKSLESAFHALKVL